MKDELQRAADRERTINKLRERITENDTLHQEREKELLRSITLCNRAYKRLEMKYTKLKKGKRVTDLERIIVLREKEIKRLRG